jgi:hypothetical protein
MSVHIRIGGTKYAHSEDESHLELWHEDTWIASWACDSVWLLQCQNNADKLNSMLDHAVAVGKILRSAELTLLLSNGETQSVN